MVVEDEEAFVDALEIALSSEGFQVAVCRDGADAIRRFEQINPDLMLLDLMLPKVSGVDVCREVRTKSTIPIIMVTAKSSEVDVVVGLEVGADDYVTKPYRMRELIARIRAMLRRSSINTEGESDGDGDGQSEEHKGSAPLTVGQVTIDVARHQVTVDENPIQLPLKEFELLHYLMANVGHVLTRDALIDRVWGYDYVGETKTLDVHIKRLRSKIESNPSKPERIVTIRGLGYKFAEA